MFNKTWFITGISSGLGLAMTRQLLRQGDRVIGTVRSHHTVQALAAEYPDTLSIFKLDLSLTDSVEAVVTRAFRDTGRIDVVVNNAGYGLFGPAEGLSAEQIKHQLDTNLLGPVLVTRAALPFLRQQGGGKIIAISSYGGQATHPGASLYHASKWGVEGFFESLSKEVASFGISVNIVEPGSARTAFRSTAGEQMGSLPEVYRDTPLGQMLSRLNDEEYVAKGAPEKMASIILKLAETESNPLRLVLGSDAYAFMETALEERLLRLNEQKTQAAASDFE
ncbi:short-chain dehydrogenase [Tatumella morbirosei]|uniref:Short-chain dehydrogenase n=1 Tax=Tatumella morbirosei TaxID=642227 RepID=A0A095UEC5_9GAMM|nr:SDR family oxidoreductase [Tatumella morbirosei]KGD72798.1 short-chain dehydrogenase [Tatumella morbirosei]